MAKKTITKKAATAAAATAAAPAQGALPAPPAAFEAGAQYRVRFGQVVQWRRRFLRPRGIYTVGGDVAEQLKGSIIGAVKV